MPDTQTTFTRPTTVNETKPHSRPTELGKDNSLTPVSGKQDSSIPTINDPGITNFPTPSNLPPEINFEPITDGAEEQSDEDAAKSDDECHQHGKTIKDFQPVTP
jgi:hypothetical protein